MNVTDAWTIVAAEIKPTVVTSTWKGLIFSNLNGTHATGNFYLRTTSGKLIIETVRFRDVVSGVDGAGGTFVSAEDPGTISTGSPESTAVDVSVKWFTNNLGLGGQLSDDEEE